MRIPIRTGLYAVTAMFAIANIAASPALGDSHPFLFRFGSFANPNGIAIDQSTGDVYVADITTATIQKFKANGSPVDFSELGSNTLTGSATPAGSFSFPEVSGTPAAIAVDNSTSPSDLSAGDLYVMDAGHEVIDKFSASGAYLGQITGPFPTTPGEPSELLGIGVDANGNLRVDVHGISAVAVDVFDDSPANNFVTFLEPSDTQGLVATSEHGFVSGPRDDYLLGVCGCIEKLGGNGEELGRVDSGSTDIAAAVDPATGHLYIDEQSSVSEWDTGGMNGLTRGSLLVETSSGMLVSSFGSPQLSSPLGQGGIAVNGGSGNIYVSNPAEGMVYVFATDVPAVAMNAATEVTKTTATLSGTVNPRGVPAVSCRFEYETTGAESQSVPCEQTAAQIGSGTSPVTVTADIGGLQPGLLYRVHLVAANADGSTPSSGLLATAGPGFGVKSFEVSFLNKDGTPDTQAGSHPYEMTTNIAFNTEFLRRETTADSMYVKQPEGDVKDVIVDLPPGFVGDPDATAKKCTLRELDGHGTSPEATCPAESRIGFFEVEFGDEPGFGGERAGGLSTVKEPVYNLAAPRGVAAQFATHLVVPNAFINAGVLAGGDYPVQASVFNAPLQAPVINSRLVIFGVPGSAESRTPLLTLPTACNGPLRSTISMDSYQEPGHFVQANTLTRDAAGRPLGVTGCSQLEFPPTITVAPDSAAASTSSGLTVGVHVSQKGALNPEGLAESALRDTTVTLPEGVAINPAGADGLQACSEGLAGFTGFEEFNREFEPGDRTATFTPSMPEPLLPGVNFCPDGSKIGTVKIHTPLLPNPLEGAVYLAAQDANPFGSLVAMYMIAEDPASGTLIKLTGEVKLTDTGQIVTTFKNTPELPFEELELHFFGGERAPLTTPSRCGTYTTQAVFTPWDGNGPVDTSSSFQITSGPNGGPCPGASLPFNPSLTGGATNVNAGAFSPFTLTMSRKDGEQNLQSVEAHLPPGLSGILSNIELCPEPQANLGECPPNSLIGETTISVGVGGDPFSVTGGKFYLTGPYNGAGGCSVGSSGCAPFGITFEVPAKAGPFDLKRNSANPAGEDPCDCVIVRGKIEVNPITAAITITSDPPGSPYAIPTSMEGIPLEIQHVNAITTRGDFQFNPTNCDKMAVTGTIHSSENMTDTIGVPFQVTNCATLGFAPKFAVSTSGKTSRANGASLSVKLTYPKAPFGSQTNIKQVKVELPKQLPSRLSTLQKACTAAQFDSNPGGCPAASIVGHAKAITPLVPVPLEGPAYFVSNGGEAFPNLIVVLQGYGVTIDLVGDTFISKQGVTSSTFKTVPDAPVGSFELTFPEGKYSALAANGNLCKRKLAVPTEFLAQNGAKITRSTPVDVTGCANHKVKRKQPTRAKKLALALKACQKKAKSERSACRRRARKRYGAAKQQG